MPKISIMTMVFGGELARGTLTDAKMLAALEAAGFDGIEVPSGDLLDSPARMNVYRAHLADSGMEVTCIDAISNFVSPEAAARAQAVDALRAGIGLAHTLGAPVVLAAGSRLFAGCPPAAGRAMIVEGLRACLPDAQAAGVTLAIEDFGIDAALQCGAGDCLEVLDAVPGLSFVFDTGNFYFAGEDPIINQKRLGARTCHVHVKDWVKSATPEIADVAGTAIGRGIIPNETIVRRFLSEGYTGPFSLELGAPGEKMAGARADLATLRRWLT